MFGNLTNVRFLLYLNDFFAQIIVFKLESRIDLAPWINVVPGKFAQKNKCSPIDTLYLTNSSTT